MILGHGLNSKITIRLNDFPAEWEITTYRVQYKHPEYLNQLCFTRILLLVNYDEIHKSVEYI